MSLSVPINFHLTPDDLLRLIGKHVCSIRQEGDRLFHIERMKIYLSKGRDSNPNWWVHNPLYRKRYVGPWRPSTIYPSLHRLPPDDKVPNKRGQMALDFGHIAYNLASYLGDGRRKWRRDRKGHYGKPNALATKHDRQRISGRGFHPNPEIYKSTPILPMTAFGDSALKDACY
tara:strand:- start:15535 stop:16053 length:519 start_codon:yes stop_codon:yes gene_type:complete